MRNEGGEVIVTISDLHANATALKAALKQARNGPMDQLVILGDLLTYGIDVNEVLDLVEAEHERGAPVVLGNHDQLYLDLADKNRDYYDTLPDWIRESVDWTMARIDVERLRTRYQWVKEVTIGETLFAHANPYAYGDWRYLNSVSDRDEAAKAISSRGFHAGVFGHNHRATCFIMSKGDVAKLDRAVGPAFVMNPGSVGQPRSSDGHATFLRSCVTRSAVSAEPERISYDVQSHVEGLRCSGMSDRTLQVLAKFFRP